MTLIITTGGGPTFIFKKGKKKKDVEYQYRCRVQFKPKKM